MIDYYEGKETTTGEFLSYLQPVANQISNQDSTAEIYKKLSRLSDELDSRENLGYFDQDSKKLKSVIQEIKANFYDDITRRQYDQRLQKNTTNAHPTPSRVYRQRIGMELTSNKPKHREVKLRPTNISWQKWLLQAIIVLIFLGIAIFMNIPNSLILIVMLVLVVFGLLVSN